MILFPSKMVINWFLALIRSTLDYDLLLRVTVSLKMQEFYVHRGILSILYIVVYNFLKKI